MEVVLGEAGVARWVGQDRGFTQVNTHPCDCLTLKEVLAVRCAEWTKKGQALGIRQSAHGRLWPRLERVVLFHDIGKNVASRRFQTRHDLKLR